MVQPKLNKGNTKIEDQPLHWLIEYHGNLIRFPQNIENALDAGDRLVLLLRQDDFGNSEEAERNVVCLDKTGVELWRIEPIVPGRARNPSSIAASNAFQKIGRTDEDVYFAINGDNHSHDGTAYVFDIDTGQILYSCDLWDLFPEVSDHRKPKRNYFAWLNKWLNALTMSPRDRFR